MKGIYFFITGLLICLTVFCASCSNMNVNEDITSTADSSYVTIHEESTTETIIDEGSETVFVPDETTDCPTEEYTSNTTEANTTEDTTEEDTTVETPQETTADTEVDTTEADTAADITEEVTPETTEEITVETEAETTEAITTNTEAEESEKEDPPEEIPSDEIEFPINYSDTTCNITITKEWYEKAYVYAAHIEFSSYDRLGTSCGLGEYGKYEKTSQAAERLGALLTINGCYSAPYLNYTVIRDGVLYNGSEKDLFLPAVYNSNTGMLMNSWNEAGSQIIGRNVGELYDAGWITDTFGFGPPFLTDGEVYVDYEDESLAPRTFIGTNGKAGDIWLVVCDGYLYDDVSRGLTYTQCGDYLKSKGCIFGVPLDGGGSSTMVWQGQILNAVKWNERYIVDFVYFK